MTRRKFVVEVRNHKWGHTTHGFETREEAEKYIESLGHDLNTYAYLYQLLSINLDTDCVDRM